MTWHEAPLRLPMTSVSHKSSRLNMKYTLPNPVAGLKFTGALITFLGHSCASFEKSDSDKTQIMLMVVSSKSKKVCCFEDLQNLVFSKRCTYPTSPHVATYTLRPRPLTGWHLGCCHLCSLYCLGQPWQMIQLLVWLCYQRHWFYKL